MAVNPKERDDMARLIAIMNGQTPEIIADNMGGMAKINAGADDNVAAMKSILEKFYGSSIPATTDNNIEKTANRAASQVLSEVSKDRFLREALVMQETDGGLLIGIYEITAKTDSGRKLYDVSKLGEASPIAIDLTIYEAARGLAGALNDGVPITSQFVRDLLRFEGEYANAVHDAIHAKATLKKQAKTRTLTEARQAIIEDKYSSAVRRASQARSAVLTLVERYTQ
jgi:hypothetical protein